MKSHKVERLTKSVLNKLNGCIVVVDVETTGFSPLRDRIIEFAAIKVVDGKVVDSISFLINPNMHIPEKATEVNHITDKMVENCKTEDKVAAYIHRFLSEATYIVGHNVTFDIRFIEALLDRNGYDDSFVCLDTLDFARVVYNTPNHKLETLVDYLGISKGDSHRALSDAESTLMLLRFITFEYLKNNLVK